MLMQEANLAQLVHNCNCEQNLIQCTIRTIIIRRRYTWMATRTDTYQTANIIYQISLSIQHVLNTVTKTIQSLSSICIYYHFFIILHIFSTVFHTLKDVRSCRSSNCRRPTSLSCSCLVTQHCRYSIFTLLWGRSIGVRCQHVPAGTTPNVELMRLRRTSQKSGPTDGPGLLNRCLPGVSSFEYSGPFSSVDSRHTEQRPLR